MQVPGQDIPEGELVTLPLPVAATVIVSKGVNDAVTLLAADMVSEQEPVPEHAPDQPAKPYPLAGEAERLTGVP